MATLERAAKLDVLLDRLARIESALAGGATLPAASGAAPAPTAPSFPHRTSPRLWRGAGGSERASPYRDRRAAFRLRLARGGP